MVKGSVNIVTYKEVILFFGQLVGFVEQLLPHFVLVKVVDTPQGFSNGGFSEPDSYCSNNDQGGGLYVPFEFVFATTIQKLLRLFEGRVMAGNLTNGTDQRCRRQKEEKAEF